jgi:hypothetical protein
MPIKTLFRNVLAPIPFLLLMTSWQTQDSADWCERLPCLLMLWRLMRDWDGMKPTPLLLQDLPSITFYAETDEMQLQEAVAKFYTDSFFHFLGCTPIIPAHLP